MKQQVRITETLKAVRDRNGWTLEETYQAEDKDGNPKEATRDYYYGTLGQCLKKSLDINCGGCEDLAEVIEMITEFTDLTEKIKP